MKDIKIGVTYYFNNQRVKILRKETDQMYLVSGSFDITHDTTGSCFCCQCNVGGDYKGEHTCDDAQEIIDIVMEDISDKNIFWVDKSYLQEKPFEYEKNVSLLNEIERNSIILKDIKGEIKSSNETIETQKQEYDDLYTKSTNLIADIDSKTNKLSKLETQIDNGYKAIDNIDKVTKGIVNISVGALKSLIESSVRLKHIERGGVDNWAYYDEFMPNSDEIEGEVVIKLGGYLK